MKTKLTSARFLAESNEIHHLMTTAQYREAYQAAARLLERSVESGADAYDGAQRDNALARILLGQTMLAAGDASSALHPLADAQRQVDALIAAGDDSAASLAYVVRGTAADAMQMLGRHSEALALYEQAIERAEKLGALEQFVELNLHMVNSLLASGQDERALAVANAVVSTFDKLDNPQSQAKAWFHLGQVREETRHFAEAEDAYRQSLAIAVRDELGSQEGASLTKLGILYDKQQRFEDAASFYQRAADIRRKLEDRAGLGNTLSDLGNTLRRLERHDEARNVLREAIALKQPFGSAQQPWIPWGLLELVERAAGNHEAAWAAHMNATAAYFNYRAAGGEGPRNPVTALCPQAFHAIRQGKAAELDAGLEQLFALVAADPEQRAYLNGLRAILRGSRDENVAFAPELHYMQAAELLLLIKLLASGRNPG